MKLSRALFAAALTAGTILGGATATLADHRNYNVGPGHAHKGPKGPGTGGPPERRCVKSFYGEKKCNVAPNGRQFGPQAYDYAVGVGDHIQR